MDYFLIHYFLFQYPAFPYMLIGLQNSSSPYLNYWEGGRGAPHSLFVGLRDCNIFLENLVSVPGLEEEERQRWLAEVKVLKAFYHFWLVRMYGPIPIIRDNLYVGASLEESQVPRNSVDEVVDYIVELIDEVIASEALPGIINYIYTEQGRITLPAAKAIKAKALVLAASPLFNGNTDFSELIDPEGGALVSQTYDANKWVRAKDALFDAINDAHTNGHSLYEFTDQVPINGDINDVVRQELTQRAGITDPFNRGIVWAFEPAWTGDLQQWSQPRWTADHQALFNYTKKSHAPTLNMVETFYTKNGVPINEDISWDFDNRFNVTSTDENDEFHKYYVESNYSTAKLHLNREPRFYSTIGFDGQYIMIDFQRNIVVVRASLYTPIQNLSQDRKMKLNPSNIAQSNWIATVPNALGSSAGSNISVSAFYELVANSIN